ncbi:MAG: cytochrome b/b6 domain-containing protein [Phycisphaerae bacterium]
MLVGLTSAIGRAADPDNCLLCHRFRGLSRLDPETNELRLFFCSAEYYAYRQGQHARVRCTGCHERSEVIVIPHQVKTPVDCTRTCHIAPATGIALRFSHKRVAESLIHSVHSTEKLTALRFDPPLLHPGQSACLYCHDQPTFGLKGGIPAGFLSHGGGTRCDTCHSEELPLEVNYFASHVAARMKPARPVRQLTQVCAVCHSDPQIVEQIGGHDAVASYLHSFHGKASLLGSQETATCVECHSPGTGDQHLMLSKGEPDSSTHVVQLPDTCRTTACHSGAPPEMSSAAVHLELDPAKRTPEFYVAAFFILLTAGVMAVFFLLILLELLDSIARRWNPHHFRLVKLARGLRQDPQGRRLLERMTIHQRLQHWWLVVSFVVLAITGMPIKFAEARWSQSLVELVGGLTVARALHRIAGVVLIGVFLYHVGYLLVILIRQVHRDQRQDLREPIWKKIVRSPMMPNGRDVREFLQLASHLLFLRRERPLFGRYNFMQKFEYWAVFWGVPIMGLSGLALWGMPTVAELLSGRALNFAFIIHSDEAYLAFIYVAAVHLFTVILAPVVFPLSLGTLSGQAPARELAESHRGELQNVAQQIGITLPELDASEKNPFTSVLTFAGDLTRRAYSVVLMGAYGGVAFVSLRFLILMLVTRQTAPVEIVGIPKRLDADAFFAAAALPVEHRMDPAHRSRGPLAHFHQIPQWFQPDPHNTCTTAGCHSPLPHGKRVEVRAFLNMHATFTDCSVCHAKGAQDAQRARWFSLTDRDPIEVPAILQLATRLESPTQSSPEEALEVNEDLMRLLRTALPAAGHHEQLQRWLLRLETTHPRSKVWRQIVDGMRDNIHMHVHGEYGAKLGMYNGDQRVGDPRPGQLEATRTLLSKRQQLSDAERESLLQTVHEGIAPMGAMCTPCHQPDPTLMDITALGFPQTRVEQLSDNATMRAVLSIEQGEPFYLPIERDEEEP